MKKIWSQSWFIKIISLLLAILIVIYIDSTQTGFFTQGQSSRTQETADETRTVKVPLQVSVDTDKYYVTGYPEKIKLTLSGTNALVTSTVNTQNFRAYIDLTNKKVGQHSVKVHVSGLSKQLTYSISPARIKVKIQKRKSRTMPVQIEYNKNAVAKGYTLGKGTIDPSQVEVTGARSEVNEIDQIVAKVSLPAGLRQDYQRQVMLIAEDKKGRQLNVVIQPSTARVEIPVSISKKTVKLKVKSKNEVSDKIYSVTAKQNKVVLYGTEEKLAKIKSANLNVDLRGIRSSTTRSVKVELPKGAVRANPSAVEVEIKVKDSKN